jgi:predicted ATPase
MSRGGQRVGQIVAERYQLLAEIGSGGMGAIWRARHIVNGEHVALKLLQEDMHDFESARERFLREAKALHALRSPHIVHVFDSGVDAGIPFIAMELLAGETLAHRLKRTVRLTVTEVSDIVRQVAEGIGAAHEIGIVHRDLKPENIFLAREEGNVTAKLLDFGVAKAKAADTPARTLTRSGAIVGTPHYMSPEQIDGIAADWRADLWALAVITFECLLGVRPFNGNALARLCLAICDDPLPVPSTFRVVPAGFDEWFRTGVARDRAQRFQSARQLAESLAAVLTNAPATPTRSSRPAAGPVLTLMYVEIDDELRLMQHLGADYPAIKDRVDALISDVMQVGGAMIVEPARAFMFASVTKALDSAIALERGIESERWPRDYVVALRTALGEAAATPTESGVADDDLSRIRALAHAAHGGQIVLTQTLADDIDFSAARDLKLEDLGEHEIDDARPEHVFQAVAPGLNAHFAPLKTSHGIPNNLPREITEFVGRAEDLDVLNALIATNRLVTLRGPGGIGKSRLAARVAARVGQRAADGTFVVPLAAVRDPRLVIPTIASVLGAAEHGGRSAFDALIDYLAPRQMLLVLDNFEHVLQAAVDVKRILDAAPRVRVLVTSRIALATDGEEVYDVGPFDLPAEDATVDELERSDVVRLLIDRARRANPDFSLKPDNALAIAGLIRQLEGVPLAIELASARLGELSVGDLARQITGRQASLHDASGAVALRHRTLSDVVAWSYDLLGSTERTLFRRLAVFVGGFTRELAEAIGGDGRAAEIDAGISALLQSSLVRRQTQGRSRRFAMLESIREFALAELEKTGEAAIVKQRHARALCDLFGTVAPALKREGAVAARDLLALEDGNLRQALDWCLTSRDGELGVAIASSAWRYWQSVGRLHEGRRWLVELLACPDLRVATKARGLEALAGLAYWQADYATASKYYREALVIFREIGDRLAVGETLFALSTTATWSGDSVTGEALAEEALALFEEVGAREHVGMVRMAQGFALWMRHDLAGARPLWEASIDIAREVGDHVEAAHKTLALASITFAEGRVHDAIRLAVEAMDELFERHNVALTIMAIDFIASMLVLEDPSVAARLSGAATQLRGTMGGGMRPEACGLPNVSAIATDRLGAVTYRREFGEGKKLDLHRAIELARLPSTHEAPAC